jgi:hypothetical protein
MSGAAKVSVSLISVRQLGQVMDGSKSNPFLHNVPRPYADSRGSSLILEGKLWNAPARESNHIGNADTIDLQ